jgi:pimeloyl-ACP methyl ester carboxylesterase
MSIPIVLLHALAPGSAGWDEPRHALARSGHQVLAPDQRGYGTRPLGGAPPSLATVADDLARLLDEQAIGGIVLAGVSMGGYVAMEFLRRHPGRVRALALFSTRAGPDDAPAAAARHAFADAVADPVTGPRLIRGTVPALLGATTRRERPYLADRVRAMVETIAPQTLGWAQRAIAGRPDSFAVLRAADMPAAIVAGAEDELIAVREARAMAAAMPAADLVTIPAAGHLTPLEAPSAVTEALTSLIGRTMSAAC